ncbi:MAG: hypothetical protein AAGE92_01315 [Cyanobacteria bacterium P01_G01_bin.4]
MFQPRDPRHSSHYPRQSHDDWDSNHAYLEDMDVYDDGGGEEGNRWFPWVAALGLGGACIGIGLAFSWLLSPVPSTASRSTSEPTEIAQAETVRDSLDDSASSVNPLSSGREEEVLSGRLQRSNPDTVGEANGQINGAINSEDDGNPLGIALTDLPLIPVDPAASSPVRPSRITAALEPDDLDADGAARPSRDSEVLSRDGEIAVNPDLRPDNELRSATEPSREDSTPRQFFRNDSPTEETAANRRQNRDARESEVEVQRDGDRELVETPNVAVATTTSPRLELGPSFGEGSFLVLMAYQGDNSLSQARKYSQGAFIKQLDGETYVQLAAFDQLEYARHMADSLRNQGVAVLILH